ncbi:antirepressor [Roseivivax halodurans JCM 10272]|uniref:Antirepressor n=1 Tax=Roseivivax halodurans JCM 10272 TaxID=1449350 RepID=X7ECF8_9RHOB|nr:antirepressor [Roseivivax halodurans JCM 10272]
MGTSLFGNGTGWQARLSEAIGVTPGAVTRWLSGCNPIPTPVSLVAQYMLIAGVPDRLERPTVCENAKP